MESFFDNTHTLDTLAHIWTDRKAVLRKEQEQEICDMLYKSIRESILDRRDSIFAELQECIGEAASRTQLCVELWAYYQVSFKKLVDNYHEKLAAHREYGNDWMISNIDHTKVMTVREAILKTDICARVNTLFGEKFAVVERPSEITQENGEWKVVRRALYLYYFPEGRNMTSPGYIKYMRALDKYLDVPLPTEESTLYAGPWSIPVERQLELNRILSA